MPRTGPTGGPLSYGQLEGLWIGAGGPRWLSPVMAAIALAESGGNPNALNPVDSNGRGGTQSSYGLWQISNGTHTPPNPNWADPTENASLAVQKWKGYGLRPWGTYTSGAYLKFLRKGVPPIPWGGGPWTGYRDPLRAVKNLKPYRVDMGVDYGGTGPVFALGPGVITATHNSGWPGGGFIGERFTAGPLRGHYVYVAEDVNPQVQVGQRVTSGTVIGQLTGGGIETGFAAPPGTGGALAAELGQQAPGRDPGGWSSAVGVAYSKILAASGAPAGIVQAGGPHGTDPTWLDKVLGSLGLWGGSGTNPPVTGGGGGSGGLFGSIEDVATALGRIATVFEDLTTAIDWLLNPENWVRIIAGIAGGVFMLGGIWNLTHIGSQVNVPLAGPATLSPAALPVGILMVGTGGVLLFVAFHNLGAANVGELLGTLRDKAQAASNPAGTGGGQSL